MKLNDQVIVDCLDDSWRSVSQIRSRLRVYESSLEELADALRRLSADGRIETKVQGTNAPKRKGPNTLTIQLFRRLQRLGRERGR